MLYNTKDSYGSVAKSLHWFIALAMIIIVLLGFTFTYATSLTRLLPVLKDESITAIIMKIHKSLGLSILLLMCFRVGWRMANPPPPYPSSMPAWQQYFAHSIHYLFYLLIFLTITIGWMMSAFAGYPTYFWGTINVALSFLQKDKALENFGESTHSVLSWIIIGVFIIHVGAALWHHFIVKDNILKRMLTLSK